MSATNNQPFERLIRLEDEELDSHDGLNDEVSNDSCKVPMISPGNDSLDNLLTGVSNKHKQKSSLISGLHFTINGRHIQMNPEQLKYLSLITLTIQNAALNLTMRAARTQEEQFSTAVAVTVSEILKLITCLILIWYNEITLDGAYRSIKTNIIDNYMDTLKVAVPSFVYYVQNNLLYVGSTHLDAATNQVTYQLKILTTAIFSVVMLDKKFSKIQWLSLFLLFAGVALIEFLLVSSNDDVQHRKGEIAQAEANFTSSSHSLHGHIITERDVSPSQISSSHEKPLIGILAVLTACCLSGFAGVYFEKILKSSSHISIWIRNVQLSALAIPIGLMQLFFTEYDQISTRGFWYGFTPVAWLCIVLQAQGGLLVAVVVKFANNILKGFATSMAIVISTVVSIFLFNFAPTPGFVLGASLVIGSVMMYNKQ